MSAFTISHGTGPDCKVIHIEVFTDLNPPSEIADLGGLIIRAQVDADRWVRFVPPDDCPGCSGSGTNELQRLCNACVNPALQTILNTGQHPALTTLDVSEKVRGKMSSRPYALIDLRNKAMPQKKKHAKERDEDPDVQE